MLQQILNPVNKDYKKYLIATPHSKQHKVLQAVKGRQAQAVKGTGLLTQSYSCNNTSVYTRQSFDLPNGQTVFFL